MNNRQRTRLAAALTELQFSVDDIVKSDGLLTRLRPFVSYRDDRAGFDIEIEITTGREVLSPGLSREEALSGVKP